MQLKIKKLSEKANTPTRANKGDAGLDLYAASFETLQLPSGPAIEYNTDIAVEIPEGYVGLLFARSSITTKTSLMMGNSVGVIDSSYRGAIKLQFRATAFSGVKKYEIGDKIGQLVVVPYVEVNVEEVKELSETTRGAGAFGSSGE